jgi:hypothetical protein
VGLIQNTKGVSAYGGSLKNLKDLNGKGPKEPGTSSVAYLVMQNGKLEHGEPRCGFNTKHQSTKGHCTASVAQWDGSAAWSRPSVRMWLPLSTLAASGERDATDRQRASSRWSGGGGAASNERGAPVRRQPWWGCILGGRVNDKCFSFVNTVSDCSTNAVFCLTERGL